MGEPSNPGIIPLMNRELFDRVAALTAAADNRQFMVLVSYLEIYNEVRRRGAWASGPCTPTAGRAHATHTFAIAPRCARRLGQVIKDLLNPSDKQLMIREHPEMGIYVQARAGADRGMGRGVPSRRASHARALRSPPGPCRTSRSSSSRAATTS